MVESQFVLGTTSVGIVFDKYYALHLYFLFHFIGMDKITNIMLEKKSR